MKLNKIIKAALFTLVVVGAISVTEPVDAATRKTSEDGRWTYVVDTESSFTSWSDSNITVPKNMAGDVKLDSSVSSTSSITIPATIDGIPVYNVGKNCISSYTDSIVLEEGIQALSTEAFINFTNTTSYTFPDSITYIGYHAIYLPEVGNANMFNPTGLDDYFVVYNFPLFTNGLIIDREVFKSIEKKNNRVSFNFSGTGSIANFDKITWSQISSVENEVNIILDFSGISGLWTKYGIQEKIAATIVPFAVDGDSLSITDNRDTMWFNGNDLAIEHYRPNENYQVVDESDLSNNTNYGTFSVPAMKYGMPIVSAEISSFDCITGLEFDIEQVGLITSDLQFSSYPFLKSINIHGLTKEFLMADPDNSCYRFGLNSNMYWTDGASFGLEDQEAYEMLVEKDSTLNVWKKFDNSGKWKMVPNDGNDSVTLSIREDQENETITIPSTLYGYDIIAFDVDESTTNDNVKHIVFAENHNLSEIESFSHNHPSFPELVSIDMRGLLEINSLPESFMESYEKLESVQLPDTITTLNNKAFYACEKLTTINLPLNGTYGDGCLAGTAIESFTFGPTASLGSNMIGGIDSNIINPIPAKVTKVTFQGTVSIPQECISGLADDAEVVLEYGVKNLGEDFCSFNSPMTITVPKSVESVGRISTRVTVDSDVNIITNNETFLSKIVFEDKDATVSPFYNYQVSNIKDIMYNGDRAYTQNVAFSDMNGDPIPTNHFEVGYINNTGIGQATCVITPMSTSSYEGVRNEPFSIDPKLFTREAITFTGVTFSPTDPTVVTDVATYRHGSEVTIPIALYDGQTKLIADADYTISYMNNVTVGTADVFIRGKGNYKDDIHHLTFTITPFMLTDDMLTVEVEGEDKLATVKISDSILLVEDVDYTLSIDGNTVSATGIGNYEGTIQNIVEEDNQNQDGDSDDNLVDTGSVIPVTGGGIVTGNPPASNPPVTSSVTSDMGAASVPTSNTKTETNITNITTEKTVITEIKKDATIKTPAKTIIKNTKNVLKIKKQSGVKYEVYRKVGKGKWKKFKTLTKTKKVSFKVNKKKGYSYKVRAVSTKDKARKGKFSKIVKFKNIAKLTIKFY